MDVISYVASQGLSRWIAVGFIVVASLLYLRGSKPKQCHVQRSLVQDKAISNGSNVNNSKTTVTYRVRGIPCEWDQNLFEALLTKVLCPTSSAGINVCSLAKTPYAKKENVATVVFLTTPGFAVQEPLRDEWRLDISCDADECQGVSNISLVFDTHFRGFTPLHSERDEVHKLE